MVRRLTHLSSGLGLTALLVAALGCTFEVSRAMTSPMAGTEAWLPAGTPRAPAAESPAAPAPFEPGALLTQPVFLMSRTPVRPAAPAAEMPVVVVSTAPPAPEPAPVPPGYILSGIMITGSDQRVLLKTHKTEKGIWFSRGQSTQEGWTVLTVNPEDATIARASSQFTLQFRPFRRSGTRG